MIVATTNAARNGAHAAPPTSPATCPVSAYTPVPRMSPTMKSSSSLGPHHPDQVGLVVIDVVAAGRMRLTAHAVSLVRGQGAHIVAQIFGRSHLEPSAISEGPQAPGAEDPPLIPPNFRSAYSTGGWVPQPGALSHFSLLVRFTKRTTLPSAIRMRNTSALPSSPKPAVRPAVIQPSP